MSTPASRARSIPSITSLVLPVRSPTVGLTWASATLTPQLSLAALLTIGILDLLRPSPRAFPRTPDDAMHRTGSRPRPHRGRSGGCAETLPRGGQADRGACVLLQAEQRFLGAVRARWLGGAAGAARSGTEHTVSARRQTRRYGQH